MDLRASIVAEIEKLQRVLSQLDGDVAPKKTRGPAKGKRKPMSAAARAKIAAAQKLRWAKVKKNA